MPSNDLRVAELDWRQLRKLALPSFRLGASEVGAIGLIGSCACAGKHEYILSKILWPQSGDVKEARDRALVFDASYIRRAHLEMREKKLPGLAFFHSHPLADETVGFSKYDNLEEPKLVANLREIEAQTVVVSVVLGKNSQCGRVWTDSVRFGLMERLLVVGELLTEYSLDGKPLPRPPHPSEIFSRGDVLTGPGALARLGRMTVAVVGASGTGSLVCELLARAGCKRILLIDFDVSKLVNLNRVLYMKHEDVDAAVPKVDVIKRGIEGLGLGCEVIPIRGNVLNREILARLREADAVIGCLDKSLPRDLLGRFSFQYFRPYIDVGSEIGGDEAGIAALNARANYIVPGRHCLQCAGIVTSRELHYESISSQERERVVAQGYSKDLVLEKPAVMDLNMHAAASGVLILRHILQPFLSRPLPVTISENLITYRTVAPEEARAANSKCPICKANPFWGQGDCGPTLGYEKEDLRTLAT